MLLLSGRDEFETGLILDEVSVISGVIKVEVSRSPKLITLNETLINPYTTKTKPNNYLIVKGLNPGVISKKRLSLIVRVNVVLNRTVVVDSDSSQC